MRRGKGLSRNSVGRFKRTRDSGEESRRVDGSEDSVRRVERRVAGGWSESEEEEEEAADILVYKRTKKLRGGLKL